MGDGHSSYSVWLVYAFRAIEKILPALKGKSKYGWVPPFLLCLVTLASFVGVGIYTDGYGIHPPANYPGICAPPAFIRGQNCWQSVTITATSGSSTVTKYSTVTAGSVVVSTTRGG